MLFYIIVGSITFIAFILLIIAIYYNRFQFSIIKIEEAVSNIEIYLNKKLELLKLIIPVIKKELKLKEFLETVNESQEEKTSFELNIFLSELCNEVFKTLDDQEKLLKKKKITNLIQEINDNDELLIASIKFYNDTVVDFNRLIFSFPSNLIRLFFGYKKKEFYTHEKRQIYEILKEEKKEG